LNNNPLKDEGLISIANGLIENDTLRVITLQNVQISEACIPQLSNCLQNKKFLTKLLLDGNIIGVEGAKALAKGIRDNETLTNLHLSDCLIMEDGAKELANSLENKRNLLVLDLTNNKIMSDGCIAICKAIQTQSTLRELLLS
jgi:Ran GTPase-activating protein (RanGAP) involved in mRNA processing and transport